MRALCTVLVLAGMGCGLSDVGSGLPIQLDAAPPRDGTVGAEDHAVPPGRDGGGDASVATDATVDAIAEASVDSGPLASYALSFDGKKTYVDCAAVPIPGDFTIEAWVYPGSFDGETYVMAEDKAFWPPGQFRFGFIDGGQLFFVMSDASSNTWGLQANSSAPYSLLSLTALPTNTWAEVAVTKNGAAFSLLVDGVVVASFTASGSFVYGYSGQQNPFRIGSRVANDGQSVDGVFDGIIDEVRLWNAPRSSAQITADMRHEITVADPDWGTLQDYWPFDEGTGTLTADRAGLFPGTLVSGPAWVKSTAF